MATSLPIGSVINDLNNTLSNATRRPYLQNSVSTRLSYSTLELAQIIQADQAKTGVLQKEMDDRRIQISNLDIQMSERRKAIWDVETRVQNLEDRAVVIEASACALAKRVSTFENIDFAAIDKRFYTLEWYKDAHQKKIRDAEDRIIEAEKTLTGLSASLSQVQTEQSVTKKKQVFEAELSECLSVGQLLGFVDPTLSLSLFEMMLKQDFDRAKTTGACGSVSYENFPRNLTEIYRRVHSGSTQYAPDVFVQITHSINQRSLDAKAKAESVFKDLDFLKASSSQERTKSAALEERLEIIEWKYITQATLEQHSQTTAAAHAALHCSVTGLRAEFDATKKTVEQQAAVILQLGRTQEAERESQKKALEAMQTQQAAAQQKIVELQAAASQVNARGAAMEKLVSQKVDAVTHETKVAELKAIQEEQIRPFLGMADKVASTETEVDALKMALFQSNEDRKALETKVDLMGREILELNAKMNSLFVMLEASVQKNQEMEKKLQAQMEERMQQREELLEDTVKTGINNLSTRLDGYEDRLNQLSLTQSTLSALTTARSRRSIELSESTVSPRTVSPRSRVTTLSHQTPTST